MTTMVKRPNAVAERYWAEILTGPPLEDDRPRRRKQAVQVRIVRNARAGQAR